VARRAWKKLSTSCAVCTQVRPSEKSEKIQPAALLRSGPVLVSQYKYPTVLLSVIVGLGVTDLAQGVRDLLHPDRPVRWDGLPLV
jgi:hypothetical protein